MPDHRILSLSTHQMIAFSWRSGVARQEAVFESGDNGVRQFSAYLEQHRSSVYHLLVNLAEEGFQLETIPFLQSADRKAVIARKLGQLYYTTPYTASLSLGFEKTRRKDENLLFAALTSPASLEPWIAAINAARVALSGVYSLPFLGTTLLQKLRISDERCLLLTVQDQTIRETYFERGALHFSRLSPLTHTSIGGIAQGFATEAVKLQQYLLSQRLIARNQPLRAIVVAHPQAVRAIESSCVSTESLTYDIVTTERCARAVGFKGKLGDSHLDPIFAHLLASAPPRAQFAPEEIRHDYRLWQGRRALQGLGIVALIGCLLFAGKQAYTAHDLGRQAEQVAAEAQTARQRYEDIVRTFPSIPTSNDVLRQVINRYNELGRGGMSPEPMLMELSSVLNQYPMMEISTVEWKAAGGTSAATTPTPAEQPAAQTLLIKGSIHLGSRATPREVLGVFEQFRATLAALKGNEVKAVEQPFDIESGKALKSGSVAELDMSKRPFALQIMRREVP